MPVCLCVFSCFCVWVCVCLCQTWYLSFVLHKCIFGFNFFTHDILRQNSVNNRSSNKTAKIAINFAYMATFSTSHTCYMWRISDFSESVMWRHMKFLHMWRNCQFPHNCHTWKAEISPHDNFSPLSDISDKYQVWSVCVCLCVSTKL